MAFAVAWGLRLCFQVLALPVTPKSWKPISQDLGDVATLHPDELTLELAIRELKPRVVVLMSGKRKSGKDYIASRLLAGWVA